MRAFLLVVLASTVVLGSGTASADVRQECLGASSSAQDLRRSDKLIESRVQLLVCAREQCPVVIRRDCAQWLAEVESSMPTVVLTVRDAAGTELVNAHIVVDGAPFLERLDGKAKPINPGMHKIRIEAKNAAPLEQDIVIREGEKNRLLALQLPRRAEPPTVTVVPPTVVPTNGDAPVPANVPSQPAATSPPPVSSDAMVRDDGRGARPRRAWVGAALAGVGAIAIGVGVWAGVDAKSKRDHARELGCTSNLTDCPALAYPIAQDAYSRANLSTAFLIGGLVAAGGGAILWFTAPRPESPLHGISVAPSASGVSVSFSSGW